MKGFLQTIRSFLRSAGSRLDRRRPAPFVAAILIAAALLGLVAGLLSADKAARVAVPAERNSTDAAQPTDSLGTPAERIPLGEHPGDEFASLPVLPRPPRTNTFPPGTAGTPRVAIVIDDMGMDRVHSNKAVALPAAVTLAYLPYAENLGRQTESARAAGHELLVHMPMEPVQSGVDPGPDALRVGLSEAEIRRRVARHLSAFSGYVGINNHMGSRFSAYAPGMEIVIDELRARRLLFLDSRTTAHSVGADLAAKDGIAYTERQVFLDNEPTPAAIAERLRDVEAFARQHGAAVAIGHPHAATLDALARWIPDVQSRGFVLVPITAVSHPSAPVATAPGELSPGPNGRRRRPRRARGQRLGAA